MRRRSSWAVSLGLLALVGSWLFGSKPAAVVGVGLVVAGLSARLWARIVRDSSEIERRLPAAERVEGADLVVEVRASRRFGPFGGSLLLRQRLDLFEQQLRVVDDETTITFRNLIRGRHRLEPLLATLVDPFGLERVEQRVGEPVDILVRPLIPVLASVFAARGARETGASRSAFRQPTGFEIHSVREYVPGEPVRSVHWPSTARRGRLMVKELDDAPREDLIVVLDLDAECVVGPPGASSFDAAVRAAGAIVLAHVRWERRVAIVGTAPASLPVHVRTRGHDWEVVLDALAAAEPVPGATVEQALRTPVPALTRAREIVVVTGRLGPAADALVEFRRGGRAVSIVAVASETYAGRAHSGDESALLRASSAGIPVAVLSALTSIEVALAGEPLGAIGA